MKYTKLLWLLAFMTATSTMFAATASATELTSPAGTKLGVGSVIKSVTEGSIKFDGSITIECAKAGGEGEVTNAGGSGVTVEGFAVLGSINECGHDTVTVVKTGTVVFHSIGNGNGTLTSTDAEVTLLTHAFFTSITIHCIYKTNATHIGTVTGSGTTGGTATLDIGSAPIPEKPTDASCGEDAALTGNVTVTSPDALYID